MLTAAPSCGRARLLVVLMPHIPGFDTDSFLSALFDEAGNVPVFGGVTTGVWCP